MTDIDQEYDVAVIDEIQMINDDRRGHNWTNALLGLKAKEIHLCGEEKALRLVISLIEELGDEITIHQYGRLSPIEVENTPFTSWDDLRTGDCIVSFSKKQIYKLKEELNVHLNTDEQGRVKSNTNHSSVIYGALPPESKMMQQEAFNERIGNIKYLIATDAIGMGMNLNINRLIFASLVKIGFRKKRLQLDGSGIQ